MQTNLLLAAPCTLETKNKEHHPVLNCTLFVLPKTCNLSHTFIEY